MALTIEEIIEAAMWDMEPLVEGRRTGRFTHDGLLIAMFAAIDKRSEQIRDLQREPPKPHHDVRGPKGQFVKVGA
jgi:hypothetical protein